MRRLSLIQIRPRSHQPLLSSAQFSQPVSNGGNLSLKPFVQRNEVFLGGGVRLHSMLRMSAATWPGLRLQLCIARRRLLDVRHHVIVSRRRALKFVRGRGQLLHRFGVARAS